MLASALREERGGKNDISSPPCPTLEFSIGFTVGCVEHWYCCEVCSTLLGIFRVICGQPEKNLMGFRGTYVYAWAWAWAWACARARVLWSSLGWEVRDHYGVACLGQVAVALSLGQSHFDRTVLPIWT